MYIDGKGVNKNITEAIEWLTRASENNLSKAFAKLKNIAEEGNAKAQNSLGDLYKSGKGVNKDIRKAIKWYKVSAKRGNPNAIETLKSLGLPCKNIPTVTYEGKTYHTVQIGEQCWFKENLDVGTMTNSYYGERGNNTIEKYCYNNDSSNCNIYGGLYEWVEATQWSRQGICPSGWHIPTNSEWKILQSYLNDEVAKLIDRSQTMANGLTPSNTTGFSALFAGECDYFNGSFNESR